jgi:hypothetical protein
MCPYDLSMASRARFRVLFGSGFWRTGLLSRRLDPNFVSQMQQVEGGVRFWFRMNKNQTEEFKAETQTLGLRPSGSHLAATPDLCCSTPG